MRLVDQIFLGILMEMNWLTQSNHWLLFLIEQPNPNFPAVEVYKVQTSVSKLNEED